MAGFCVWFLLLFDFDQKKNSPISRRNRPCVTDAHALWALIQLSDLIHVSSTHDLTKINWTFRVSQSARVFDCVVGQFSNISTHHWWCRCTPTCTTPSRCLWCNLILFTAIGALVLPVLCAINIECEVCLLRTKTKLECLNSEWKLATSHAPPGNRNRLAAKVVQVEELITVMFLCHTRLIWFID